MAFRLHEPLFHRSRCLGIPILYLVLVGFWFLVCALAVPLDRSPDLGAIGVALVCYVLILLRPAREIPYALLLLSTLSVDQIMYVGPVLVLLRCIVGREVYVQASPVLKYLFLFLFSIGFSVLIGYSTVEFRPLQTLFWTVTFLAPFTLLFLRVRHGGQEELIAFLRFACLILFLELPLLLFQAISFGKLVPGDWYEGTWQDADIAGTWGFVLVVAAFFLYAFRGTKFTLAYKSTWLCILLLVIGATVGVLAEAKSYSGSILLAAGIVFIFAGFSRLLPYKIWSVSFALVLVLTTVVAANRVQLIYSFFEPYEDIVLEHSRKIHFLERTFVDIGREYNHSFGVGPGMLGSRAANLVSGNVLYKKNRDRLPDFFRSAPEPERWGMAGLWDRQLAENIVWMSSTLVMPFSGVGALKAELGWIGLILFYALIIRMAIEVFPRPQAQLSQAARTLRFTLSVILVGALILCVFDTIWEQPKIMLALGALFLMCPRESDHRHGDDEIDDKMLSSRPCQTP